MSKHSQLLRGLFAMPLLLLLAIAGVIAPDAAPAPPQIPPAAGAIDDAERAVAIAVVRTAPARDCPRAVRRMALAAR